MTCYSNSASRSVENTLLLCLFVIGLLGTMYFFKQAKSESSAKTVYYSSLQSEGGQEVNFQVKFVQGD